MQLSKIKIIIGSVVPIRKYEKSAKKDNVGKIKYTIHEHTVLGKPFFTGILVFKDVHFSIYVSSNISSFSLKRTVHLLCVIISIINHTRTCKNSPNLNSIASIEPLAELRYIFVT